MKFTIKTEATELCIPLLCGNKECENSINVPLSIISSGKGGVKCNKCGHTTSLEGSSKHENL